jgi:hypothetical protein
MYKYAIVRAMTDDGQSKIIIRQKVSAASSPLYYKTVPVSWKTLWLLYLVAVSSVPLQLSPSFVKRCGRKEIIPRTTTVITHSRANPTNICFVVLTHTYIIMPASIT